MALKCQFYVEKKSRGCNAPVKPGFNFCGNHLSFATGTGERVPCPYDPTHHILESEVEEHKHRCPFLRQQRELQKQPYYAHNCNAGQRPPGWLPATQEESREKPSTSSRAARRTQHVQELGLHGLLNIIQRVERAVHQVCPEVDICLDVPPPESDDSLKPDHVNPFSLRHAMQQASIVGNMRRFGLLESAEDTVFVEFGAGKGYLSCMLCKCCSAQIVVLVDNQGFRQKAERSLRKVVQVERKRMDIKDFDPRGLPQLQAKAASWVALGKHLCGSASDYTLRCCANSITEPGRPEAPPISQRSVDGEGCCDGDCEAALGGRLRGFAVATCCHHRCCWEHYVGTAMFESLGFRPVEFEMVSWMTGWALCGHEAPAGTLRDADDEATRGSCSEAPRKSGQKHRAALARERAHEILSQRRHQSAEHWEPRTAGTAEVASASPVSDLISMLEGAASAEDRLPAAAIPRRAKIAIGQMCKRLIDQGRLLYLRDKGFEAESVLYVPAELSGENRLILGSCVC